MYRSKVWVSLFIRVAPCVHEGLAYTLDAPLVRVGQQSAPSTSSSFGGLLYRLHWPHVVCNVGLKPLKPSFETAESWDGSLNQGAEAHSCGSEDTFHLASASGREFSHFPSQPSSPLQTLKPPKPTPVSLTFASWHLRLFFRASVPPLRNHFSIVCCPLCSTQRSGSVPLFETAGFTAETAETFVGTLHDNRVRAALSLPSGWS